MAVIPRLTPVERVKMRDERAKGRTLRQIADRYGVSVTTVFNHTRGVVLEGGDVPASHLRGRGEISALAGQTSTKVEAVERTNRGQ